MRFTLKLILLILLNLSFLQNSFSDNHNIYETLEIIKNDLKTLERAVYSGSIDIKTSSRATLRKQSTFLRKNKKLNVTIEGHADERGTREYNLALGERRANAAKDYLMTYGISGKRISVISYGKEKPVNPASTPLAWSQNRRSVTVKAN